MLVVADYWGALMCRGSVGSSAGWSTSARWPSSASTAHARISVEACSQCRVFFSQLLISVLSSMCFRQQAGAEIVERHVGVKVRQRLNKTFERPRSNATTDYFCFREQSSTE